jgi:hypothetical protein
LFLVLTGLIIGLGSISLMDVLGLRGRRSRYWTETAIRVSRVSRPLTWAGIGLIIIGWLMLYRAGITGVGTIQEFFLLVIILNGAYLSLVVTPKLQALEVGGRVRRRLPAALERRLIIHFAVSFVAWWSEVALLVWQLMVTR